MSSNEEYLDGLLKSVTNEEMPKKSSFSSDDLSRMLDQLEDLEDVPPVKELSSMSTLGDSIKQNTPEINLNKKATEDQNEDISEVDIREEDVKEENIKVENVRVEDNENLEENEVSTDDISLDDLLSNLELNTQDINESKHSEFDEISMEVNNQELFTTDYPIENNETVDEMDALLADLTNANSEISELLGSNSDGETELIDVKKKKKQKKEKKGKNKESIDNVENDEGLANSEMDLLFQDSEENPAKEIKEVIEKKGLLHKISELFFSEDEESEVDSETEKTEKPEKKDKKNKKDKSKVAPDSDNPEAEETDENKKNKKGSKEKKEKVKKIKKEKTPQKSDGIKIPKGRFIKTFLICFSIFAIIMVISVFGPRKIELMMAKDAYYSQDYTKAFRLLDGKKLNSSDQIIYARTFIILQLQRKIDSYNNYIALNKPLEALDALMQGIEKYDEIKEDAKLYNVTPQIEELYLSIIVLLSDHYQLTEAEAREIVLYEYDWVYSKRLESIVYGTEFINPYEQTVEVPVEESTTIEPELEDLLPEEVDMLEE